MWNVVIYGKNQVTVRRLKKLLGSIADYEEERLRCFDEPEKLCFYLEDASVPPSIVMIGLTKGENGVDLARKVKKIRQDAQIIFMAKRDTYRFDAYNVEHVFCLEEPIQMESLQTAMARCLKNLAEYENDAFRVVTQRAVYSIIKGKVEYAEKEERRLILHCIGEDQPHCFYGKFSDIHNETTPNFCRCHKSFVVNLRYVSRMEEHFFCMKSGAKIPISRQRYAAAKQQYIEFLQLSKNGIVFEAPIVT